MVACRASIQRKLLLRQPHARPLQTLPQRAIESRLDEQKWNIFRFRRPETDPRRLMNRRQVMTSLTRLAAVA